MTSAATARPPCEITQKILTNLKDHFDPIAPGMIDDMVRDGRYKVIDAEQQENGKQVCENVNGNSSN